MNKYLQLFRLGNGAMGIVGILAAAFIAAGAEAAESWRGIAVACAVVVVFIAGGNSVNDYIDRDVDRTAHPERPVPSGRMAPETALRLGLGCLALSCAMSVALWDPLSVGLVCAACALMLAYEVALKQRGFVGNAAIAALTGMVFLLGGAVVGRPENGLAVAAMAALVTVGREVAKDVEDMEGDAGRRTLPMRIGKPRACAVAAAFFVAGPALSLWPGVAGAFGPLYWTVLAADAMFIYAATVVFRDPHRAQKASKAAMLAALLAFILGVIR